MSQRNLSEVHLSPAGAEKAEMPQEWRRNQSDLQPFEIFLLFGSARQIPLKSSEHLQLAPLELQAEARPLKELLWG